MEAFCSMFEKMGHETYLVLAPKYRIHYRGSERIIIGKGIEEVVNLGFDIIISYNIGSENISLAKRCRKRNIRFYYVTLLRIYAIYSKGGEEGTAYLCCCDS